MIKQLLNIFSRDTFCTGERQQHYELETVDSKRTSNFEEQIKPRYNNPEIQALANEFGGLLFAGRLEITLHHLLEIVPRKRRKADSYKGLRSELKRYGVDLVITSKKPNKTI